MTDFKPAIIRQAEEKAQAAKQEHEAALNTAPYERIAATLDKILSQLGNQPTIDVSPLVRVVEALDKTIAGNKLDLSSFQASLDAIPKELPDFPEPKETVAVSNLSELGGKLDRVERAIKGLKLDPTIEVATPDSDEHAQELDLEPLKATMLQVVAAIKSQTFPEPAAVDLSALEKRVDTSNNYLAEANAKLQKLIDKPVGRSGGGGSSLPPALAVRIDDQTTAGAVYIGKASPSAQTDKDVWQIAKLDTSSGLIKTWADGDASFNNVWDDRAGLTYS